MKRINTFYLFTIILIYLVSCINRKEDNELSNNNQIYFSPSPVLVTSAKAQAQTFYHELICNGIVEAGQTARIGFEVGGIIDEIPIVNGQIVSQGQLLAKINDDEQRIALERAHNNLQRAKVEMKHFLLGYSASADTSSLPAQVLKTARIHSGLAEAELSVKELELRLSKTRITSPFSGRVVDLKAKPHNPTSSYEYLCHIVNENSLQVVFSVLENELHTAELGAEVEAYPFTNPTLRVTGTITEINRLVDKSGMVRITANLKPSSHLIQGMNVRVLVRKPITNKLVIPVEGLTRRQNRDVVFVLRDSLAHWHYVEVGPRNTKEVIIESGISEGDRVIVSGNATIGHEAWVKERND